MKKIDLNLEKHCIKTEFKSQYEKILKKCLKGKADENEEIILEILKEVLEKNDLAALRGKHKELAGKNKICVEFFFGENTRYLVIENKDKIQLK